MMITNFFENDFVKLEKKEGIIFGTFKKGDIDIEKAKIIIKTRILMSEGVSTPLLISDLGLKHIDKKSRDYLASEEAIFNLKACAIVSGSQYSAYLANFFMKISIKKPKVPTKIFNKKVDALKWLSSFKELT